MKLPDGVCERARDLIADRLGLDFREERRADLERGLACALRSAPVSSAERGSEFFGRAAPDELRAPEAFLEWLATLPAESPEWRQLAAHLTVGETYFFRDAACFEALEQEVLPTIIGERRSEGVRRLRLWSAACATGEEPYSLAILLDRLLPDSADWTVTILATDISPRAIEAARQGRYREWSLRETPPPVRQRYFRRRADQTFELDPRIRALVTLAPLNLAADGYPSLVTNTVAMDLILCRNVLMYFTRQAQQATAARLRRALVAGGWLVVSPVEASTELFRPLAPVRMGGAVFYRNAPVTATAGASPPSWPTEAVSPNRDGPLVEAVASPPTRTELQRARALANEGRLEEARDLCATVATRDRLNSEACLLLAAICQERGEIAPALEALRRAIYIEPNSALAHFLRGGLLFRRGERGRGRRSMETVVRLLATVSRDEAVPGADGLTVGRLLETARAYLEAHG